MTGRRGNETCEIFLGPPALKRLAWWCAAPEVADFAAARLPVGLSELCIAASVSLCPCGFLRRPLRAPLLSDSGRGARPQMKGDSPSPPPFRGLHMVTCDLRAAAGQCRFLPRHLHQRLVRKTVPLRRSRHYHLYYATRRVPGTILTFFPSADRRPRRAGPAMAQAYAYAVRRAASTAGGDLAEPARSAFDGPEERFGARSSCCAAPTVRHQTD